MHASLPPSKAVLYTPAQYYQALIPTTTTLMKHNEGRLTRNHAGPYDDDVIRRNLLQTAASTSSSAAADGMTVFE